MVNNCFFFLTGADVWVDNPEGIVKLGSIIRVKSRALYATGARFSVDYDSNTLELIKKSTDIVKSEEEDVWVEFKLKSCPRVVKFTMPSLRLEVEGCAPFVLPVTIKCESEEYKPPPEEEQIMDKRGLLVLLLLGLLGLIFAVGKR